MDVLVSCSAGDSNEFQSEPESSVSSESEDVATLWSYEQPLPLGVPFDTDGWSNLQFDVVGVIAPEVNVAIGVSEEDQQLVHVAFRVKGESRSEERTNLYQTL